MESCKHCMKDIKMLYDHPVTGPIWIHEDTKDEQCALTAEPIRSYGNQLRVIP